MRNVSLERGRSRRPIDEKPRRGSSMTRQLAHHPLDQGARPRLAASSRRYRPGSQCERPR
jgi:hypothetical protein